MNNSKDIVLLIQGYLGDKCKSEDLDIIIQLFRDKEHEDQFHSLLYEYWVNTPSFRHKINQNELNQMLDSIHHQINLDKEIEMRTWFSRWSHYTVRIAAILFVPLLITSIWMFTGNHEYIQNQSYITLETPFGSKLKTTLPDGTEVWQNAGTILKYPSKFTKEKRGVILTGEAYFHVSSDKKNPFFVKTTDGIITVTGTRFNVSAFPDDSFSSVVLEEGEVSYKSKVIKDKAIMLHPNEQIIYSRESGILLKEKADVEKYTSWTEGRLIFRNDPLSEVINRLKRWYNADIVLTDPDGKLEKHPFTMTIQNETLEQVLDYIAEAAELNVKKLNSSKNKNETLNKPKYIISITNK